MQFVSLLNNLTFCVRNPRYPSIKVFFSVLLVCWDNSGKALSSYHTSKIPTTISRPTGGQFCDRFMALRGRASTSDKGEQLNGKFHILRRNEGDRSKECLVNSRQ
ncbi:hypothetical protein HZH68_010570 [Vespula germanica]|uniref:Uncharacterized protein n=1 Tax=Vespula germanica TaxID=30212 RepID=A0A834JY37_VESGE|nr:hypothetical protein HZH68_010570 [Vespula germanica]